MAKGVIESSGGSSYSADGESGAKKAKSNRFSLVSADPEANAANRERRHGNHKTHKK